MVGTPGQHLNGMGPPGLGASSAHRVRGRRRLTYVPGSDSSSAAGSACSCSSGSGGSKRTSVPRPTKLQRPRCGIAHLKKSRTIEAGANCPRSFVGSSRRPPGSHGSTMGALWGLKLGGTSIDAGPIWAPKGGAAVASDCLLAVRCSASRSMCVVPSAPRARIDRRSIDFG